MDKVEVNHKELAKKGYGYLLVALVLAVMLYVVREQFVMSWGTVILLLALALELGMGIFTMLRAASREVLDREGITVITPFGRKTYGWNRLQRFEINWNYDRKKAKKVRKNLISGFLFKIPARPWNFPMMRTWIGISAAITENPIWTTGRPWDNKIRIFSR